MRTIKLKDKTRIETKEEVGSFTNELLL